MGSKTYVGQRPADDEIGDCRVVVIHEGEPYDLPHVVLHSPDGFEWGYGGSGPADLALSILADHFGEKPTREELRSGQSLCWSYHQRFKRVFVAGLDRREWTLTTEQIDEWLARYSSSQFPSP